MAPRLTELSHGAGCGCQLPASALPGLLDGLLSANVNPWNRLNVASRQVAGLEW